jgi:hypothetical protein
VIHDDGAITTPGEFATAAIVTGDATKAEGADGRTSFSINPSRLYFETRTPTGPGRLDTYVSIDFFGDSESVQPDPRLRKAYGELAGILFGGDLLAGQTTSTFSHIPSLPNTLDFEGPSSSIVLRQPMVRWTRGVADGLTLEVAAESPGNHGIEGADSLTRWPDGVLSMIWEHGRGHFRGAAVVRDLRASYNNGPTETAAGWGLSAACRQGIPLLAEKDNLTFQVTYGAGVGSYFDDSPPDAVFDSDSGSLEAIPVFGCYVGYEHFWSEQFSSTVVYGALDVENRHAQPPDAFDESRYFSANLIWMPADQWLFGGEFLRGKRQDKDGAEGTVNRYQFTSRFIF